VDVADVDKGAVGGVLDACAVPLHVDFTVLHKFTLGIDSRFDIHLSFFMKQSPVSRRTIHPSKRADRQGKERRARAQQIIGLQLYLYFLVPTQFPKHRYDTQKYSRLLRILYNLSRFIMTTTTARRYRTPASRSRQRWRRSPPARRRARRRTRARARTSP